VPRDLRRRPTVWHRPLGSFIRRPAQACDQSFVRRRERFAQLPNPRQVRRLCSVHDRHLAVVAPVGLAARMRGGTPGNQMVYRVPPKNDATGMSRMV
jgi:hypothetical protein